MKIIFFIFLESGLHQALQKDFPRKIHVAFQRPEYSEEIKTRGPGNGKPKIFSYEYKKVRSKNSKKQPEKRLQKIHQNN
ncbi:hypothetical protein HN954_01930 [bacterium]|nr:hypothetical protein [bacterium]MBT6996169.1 hypothetical protein [bacterium]